MSQSYTSTRKRYPVKRILDEGVRGKEKFFLVDWEPCLATTTEMEKWPYKTAEPRDDDKFFVDWHPSWQPQKEVRKYGSRRVKEWQGIKEQEKPWLCRSTVLAPSTSSHLSTTSSTTSTSTRRVVISDDDPDSDSEGSTSSSTRSSPVVTSVSHSQPPKKRIPDYLFEHFERDELRYIYDTLGLRLEKNASSNMEFEPDNEEEDLETALGPECAGILRKLTPHLVKLSRSEPDEQASQ